MRTIFYILIGIFLALAESSLRINFFGIGIIISFVTITAITLTLADYKKSGLVILVAGAVVLDLLSPHRFGLFLLTNIMSYSLVLFILSRSPEVRNPVVGLGIFIIALAVTHSLELMLDPQIGIYLVGLLVNSILGCLANLVVINYMPSREVVKVNQNVHFR